MTAQLTVFQKDMDRRLQAHDRGEILLGLHADESMTSIARRLDRSPSTVSREVKENGGRASYGVWPAHVKACENTKRAKPAKSVKGPLCDKVTEWLHAWCPPMKYRIDFAWTTPMMTGCA